MNIGFTGTRKGMSEQQLVKLRHTLFLLAQQYETLTFHHGDCAGADAEAHVIARSIGYAIHVHPPSKDKLRAHCVGDLYDEPADYLARNHSIVDACVLMIAAPESDTERRRSGTWATIRYARKIHKPIEVLPR